MERISPECWVLTGHTASGKSQVAVEMARLLNAEIVSMDSMTVYRGMDIGTAKPPVAERHGVPHHLLDIVDPNQLFTLHEYLELAHQTVRDITARQRQVLFVGGTPLYLKGLLRGVFEGPAADAEFRSEVEAELQRVGVEALHQRLQQVDPISAMKLHPHNTRRIIRALEVYKLTGQPISHLQMQFENPPRRVHQRVVMLDWPRDQIHQRIGARVEQMFQAGLIDEVHRLLDRYGQLSRTAIQAVGYRESVEHLQGMYDRAEAIRLTTVRTRRLARRQNTWFRSFTEVLRLPMWDEPPAATAQRAVALVEASQS
ncbi:MAG: tRNA (adenosine(37)-N6)-dimethylallyltransferase MiaA [Pirellulales bacterium]